MSDRAELKLVQTFLGASSQGASPRLEERLAWVLFFKAHTKLIRSVLRRFGAASDDVDDLEQQVWIVLVKRLGKLEGEVGADTIDGYVSKVAGREATRHRRRRSKRCDSELTAELESTLLDPGPGPLSQCEWNERRDRARAILAAARSSLSDEDHRMLVLRCVDGLDG